MLRDRRRRNSYGVVFCREDGSHLDPSTVTHQFARLAKKAGFEGLRFHDQRHTYASLGLAAGVSMRTMQELLGHASMSTTADIYTHVTDALKQEAAKAIGRTIKEGAEKNERRFSDGRHLKVISGGKH